MTFQQLIEKYPEQQVDIETRAAIHEFDGGLSRIEAEIRTARDFKDEQNKQRWHQLKVDAGLL